MTAGILNEYGYVPVVRCRECARRFGCGLRPDDPDWFCKGGVRDDSDEETSGDPVPVF